MDDFAGLNRHLFTARFVLQLPLEDVLHQFLMLMGGDAPPRTGAVHRQHDLIAQDHLPGALFTDLFHLDFGPLVNLPVHLFPSYQRLNERYGKKSPA